MNQITVGYSGVHQAYQLALAAYEAGELGRFYCSVFDAPGKWGGVLSKVLGPSVLTNRRCGGIPAALITEYPWPLLRQMLASRVLRHKAYDWSQTVDRFDRWVARKLEGSQSRIFVGAETCAKQSFQVAKRRGMTTVMDCGQVHPTFLWNVLAAASDDLGLPVPPPVDIPAMEARKAAEYALADVILVLSEVERRSFLEQGFAEDRLVEIPLWADPSLWQPPSGKPPTFGGPLRVLYIGSVELRKGIPYLLRAARRCGPEVDLTLVGTRTPLMEPFLQEHRNSFQYTPPTTKPILRMMCWRSDVLVLPSLVDAFGFVAMEAMACGLPVIVTDNCGVPVPDPSWRVPIMDADALAERLLLYARDRELCRAHGEVAAEFARQYRPETYRHKVADLFRNVLDGKPPLLSALA